MLGLNRSCRVLPFRVFGRMLYVCPLPPAPNVQADNLFGSVEVRFDGSECASGWTVPNKSMFCPKSAPSPLSK